MKKLTPEELLTMCRSFRSCADSAVNVASGLASIVDVLTQKLRAGESVSLEELDIVAEHLPAALDRIERSRSTVSTWSRQLEAVS